MHVFVVSGYFTRWAVAYTIQISGSTCFQPKYLHTNHGRHYILQEICRLSWLNCVNVSTKLSKAHASNYEHSIDWGKHVCMVYNKLEFWQRPGQLCLYCKAPSHHLMIEPLILSFCHK